jgi:hypothetical protein
MVSKVSDPCPLDRECNSLLWIERTFGLHHFQPSFNGFLDVLKSFVMSLALRKTDIVLGCASLNPTYGIYGHNAILASSRLNWLRFTDSSGRAR